MPFEIKMTLRGQADFTQLAGQPALSKRFKAVRKTLGLLQSNPRHPGLNAHKYSNKRGPNGEDVFEAYAENNTPGAYRIFWVYGPGKDVITVIAITAHP
jgi:hypothetical protein